MLGDTSTTALVIDLETTGLDPEVDRIVEIAVVGIDFDRRSYHKLFHSLVDPGIAIPPEASAIHHITTAMVAGKAPTLDRIRADLEALAHPAIPFAAHNAPFDSAFLKPAVPAWTSPWICTLLVAQHLWPDALSHSNQALRYRLVLNVPGNHPPHRAMGDALATAALLVREIETAGSVDRLLELTRQPALLRRVPFGRHRGQLWNEVPPDYLDWAARQSWDNPNIAHTIQAAREGRFLPPPDPATPT